MPPALQRCFWAYQVYSLIKAFSSVFDLDTSALVGSTAGALSVEQGVANYAIPIIVPPGISGMKPELSIHYNSNSGNGLLGIGFSLGGLSAVYRCSKTIATDGVKDVVGYDDNDRYCLDGQRLIAISGQDGKSGSEYRTEIESFSRVKFTGNHWTVETKSGQTFEYGNTDDSKIEAQGKSLVRLWTVNKITDASDNAINYVYSEDNANGEYALSRINYSNNSVRFNYEDRKDKSVAYQAGAKYSQTKRLKAITTYSKNSLTRSYNLEYQYSNTPPKRTQLASLQEYVGGKYLPKMKFSWKRFGYVEPTRWHRYNTWKSPAVISSKMRIIDVTGDGLPDLLQCASSSVADCKSWVNTGAGWKRDDAYKPKTIFNGKGVRIVDVNGNGLVDYLQCDTAGACKAWTNTGSGWQLNDNWKPPAVISYMSDSKSVDNGVRIVDVTGDGLPDFLKCSTAGQCKAWINTGSGWQRNDNWKPPAVISYMSGTNNIDNGVRIVDVTGDGLPDFLQCELSSGSVTDCKSWINTGTGWKRNDAYKPQTAITGNYSGVARDYGVRIVDVNGDGLVDYLQCDTAGACKAWINTGSGWQRNDNWKPPVVISHWNGSKNIDKGVRIVDITGEGLPDFLKCDTTGACKAWINTGSGWQRNDNWKPPIAISHWNDSGNFDTGVRIVDVSGDGLPDFLKCDTTGDCKSWTNMTSKPLLTSIITGTGTTTWLDYKPLTDPSVYTKGTNGAYPNIDIQNARLVVSSVETRTNLFNWKDATYYKYGDAKVNLKGRGNLGFGWIEARDDYLDDVELTHALKLTRTQYRQDYPYTGQVSLIEEYLDNGDGTKQLLNRQINQYKQNISHSGKVHSVYLHTNRNDVYGFTSGDLIKSTAIMNSNIDEYGNIGHLSVAHYKPTGAGTGTTSNNLTSTTTAMYPTTNPMSINFTTETINTYDNDSAKWHLGRLKTAKVTHGAINTPSITRTSNFTYNSDGLLQSETIEPNTNKSLTTTYKYDSFGNKTKSTITGSGIVSRSTTVEYSTDGKFPVKTTNALGHSETKTFDTKTGNVLTLTGPNGLTTTWEYDVLGRQAKETRADGTTTTTNYEWWTVLENRYRHAIIYKMTTTTSGASPEITYFNALNQKVKEQHTGFDGRKINSDTYYDDLGRIKQASLPYFENEQKYFVTMKYDAIGRLISTTKPADEGKTATSFTSYNGLSTTTTNALGHQKTITKNIIGKVIRIDEPKGAWLTHHYNSIGNLIKTVVGGVTTTMEYDISGNKTKMNDPDMGTWTYSYNALGKLISQTQPCQP